MPTAVSREDVLAFRLHGHGLTERAQAVELVAAAGRCGIQDTPPGSALLALHARVQEVTDARLEAAVTEGRTLLRTWSLRGAPHLVPTADASVFTTGVLPPTEAAMRHFLLGLGPALDRLGMSLADAVSLAAAEVRGVLARQRLAIGPLGAEVAARIAVALPPPQRAVWEAEGPYAVGQPLGEGVVHFCLRVLTLQGVVCFASREGRAAPFALVEEWLGEPLPEVEPDAARADLLRRYLRCHGPSTPAGFARWIGVRTEDADSWWRLVDDELAPVEHDGTSWVLAADLDALRSSPRPRGVRLLPPHDPYTQQPGRDILVAEQHRQQVWQPTGAPGAVLADGEIVATWRSGRRGRSLTLTVTAFGALPARHRDELVEEAGKVAVLRGATSADVRVEPA